jgi:hypothetical protein
VQVGRECRGNLARAAAEVDAQAAVADAIDVQALRTQPGTERIDVVRGSAVALADFLRREPMLEAGRGSCCSFSKVSQACWRSGVRRRLRLR